MVHRYDASPVRMTRTPHGFLRGDAMITRVGVLTYRTPDGRETRELRPPDEVFAPESLDSFAGVPVTLDHPAGVVTPENARALAVGALGDSVRADGRFVRAAVVVHDAAAIAAVESKSKREVSCGYTCDVDPTPGVWNGERYDAVQRNIRGNHVALVTRGRAGPDVALKLDSADAVCVDEHDVDDVNHEAVMTVKIRIDGVDFDAPEQLAQAHAQAQFKTDEALKTARAETEAAKGRADALEAEVEKLRAEASPKAIAEAVAARVALETSARVVLGAETKFDGQSDDEIRRAVIVAVSPDAKLDGRDAAYVVGRFDAAIEARKASSAADASVAAARAATTKTDAAQVPSAEAKRNEMIARERARHVKG